MNQEKETPERRREKLRQEELKGNPTGNLNDSFNRVGTGGLADLVGGFRMERNRNTYYRDHHRFYNCLDFFMISSHFLKKTKVQAPDQP